MVRVDVAAPGGTYPVLVGAGALDRLPELVSHYTGAVVVADLAVRPWTARVEAGLSAAGLAPVRVEIVGGEGAKSQSVLVEILEALETNRLDRGGCVVAVGGGTVGDLAGFAAAIWLRGVAHIQIPTSLLAMVDSSIGGKTGINSDRAKNAIGAFWQPAAVLADPACLQSLAEVHYRNAFAEIVKYAVAMDPELCDVLSGEPVAARLRDRDPDQLEAVIARCVGLKAAVVAADERDQGRRAVLNYGHTVGHALEAASGYELSHGRAVAHGMRAAAWISLDTGRCGPEVVARQDELLGAFGLPGPPPPIAVEAAVEGLARDKKARSGAVEWVLLTGLGRAETGQRVPDQVARAAVERVLA